MQIKTGVTLGLGICVGAIIGMCVNEDTKIEMITAIKKKLIFAMTGEEWHPKKKKIKPVTYSGIYNRYTTYKSKAKEEMPTDWRRVLYFETDEAAREFINKLKNWTAHYGFISVYDMCSELRKDIDVAVEYSMCKYGYLQSDAEIAAVALSNLDPDNPNKYKIIIDNDCVRYLPDKEPLP